MSDNTKLISKTSGLRGLIAVPGDKSISHRAVLFGSIAEGTTTVDHFLPSADCLSTIACMRKLGVEIGIETVTSAFRPGSGSSPSISETYGGELRVTVRGRGLRGLAASPDTLDAGNSGTTTRLLSGILAGQPFESRITGDSSLTSRPMRRIIDPLTSMGARIFSEKDNGCAPLIVGGQPLKGISYRSPVASAQVKSCILLAGLYADGVTSVTEPALSRDHTERMLRSFGVPVISDGLTASIDTAPGVKLTGQPIDVPGDISSAAYFLAAGLLIPGSDLILKNVGINPTRAGILKAIEMMGGSYEILSASTVGGRSDGEPVADIRVFPQPLHGAEIGGDLIPTLIDELPVIAVMAAFADGTTVIKDAAELRVKETDRIALVTENLTAMGADVTATDDGMVIRGGRPLNGSRIKTLKDHRIAMAFAVAGLLTGNMLIEDADCVSVSYPAFYEDLLRLEKR